MSCPKLDRKIKNVLWPSGIENMYTETSKKNLHKFGDVLSSHPQSPKISLKMISDLQDQIRQKELQCLEVSKSKQRLDNEVHELKSHIVEKDQVIERLTVENSNLKNQLQNSECNLSEYWKREVLRKSEGIKKIQDQMRHQERENKVKIDTKLKKIIQIYEEEKKNTTQKIENYEKQIENLLDLVKQLEQENSNLKNENSSQIQAGFEKQLQELEQMQASLLQDNTNLKQELEIIRRGNNLHDLAILSSDIHKISRQVHHLLTILKYLKQGKDISLSLLLEIDENRITNSSRQLIQDITQLKKELSEIKEIVSDYHAEIVGGNICISQ